MIRKIVSGLTWTTLLVGMLTCAFNIQPVKTWEGGTIYITADGSIDPPYAPISTDDNVIYTLTDSIQINISDAHGIVIEKDNIVVDGAGYTLEGVGDRSGICLVDRIGVTIRNMTIKTFVINIYLWESSHCTISQTKIEAAISNGIDLGGF